MPVSARGQTLRAHTVCFCLWEVQEQVTLRGGGTRDGIRDGGGGGLGMEGAPGAGVTDLDLGAAC